MNVLFAIYIYVCKAVVFWFAFDAYQFEADWHHIGYVEG